MHVTPSAPRWRSTLALAALALGACAPAAAPPSGPAPAPPAVPVPPSAPPVAPAPEAPEIRPVTGAPTVRVGLLVDTPQVRISSSTGFEVSSGGATLGRGLAGETVTVSASGGQLRVVGATGSTVATGTGPLLFHPLDDGMVSIGGKPYRGDALVQATAAGRVTAVNVLDVERYLLGVVPQEIGRLGDTLIEAAKAQAVAARTYAVKYMGRRASQGFDVFATTEDQVYGGAGAEHPTVDRAVLETAGEIIAYNGQPIEAYYHSTCAGRTAAIDEVWNERPVPYLVSVSDIDPATGEGYDQRSGRYRWTQRWTVQQITGILNRTLADSLPAGVSSIGTIRDMRVLERTPSGRIRALRIRTSNGDFTVGKDRIRWIFLTPAGVPLNSSKFDVQLVRDAGQVTEVVATGGGWGHGIGMCQWGAMGRARAGQDYRTILGAYYPGTTIRDLY